MGKFTGLLDAFSRANHLALDILYASHALIVLWLWEAPVATQ
jgi:hypothetical protein